MDPTVVSNGMAAVDALWHRAANSRPYSLVLLDARMPDADGLTVAAKIRERAELATTRIILLTSGERPGDPARYRELRIDAQLLKPVQQDELFETIYRVMTYANGHASKAARPAAALRPPEPVQATTTIRVLLAEDNELNAEVLEQLLIRDGYQVRLARDGREALAMAQTGDFDLLLLDIHMPELDGFDVVRAIRQLEQTTGRHLPVIALTARSRKEDGQRCLAAGMDDFLTKPIRAVDLRPIIDRVLRKDEDGKMKDQSKTAPRTDSSFIPHPSSSASGLLDARILVAACGGDPALLTRMCTSLAARAPEQMTAIQHALRDRDAGRLREAAHKTCGLLSEFSSLAGDLASALEDRAASANLPEAKQVAETLSQRVAELLRLTDGLTLDRLMALAQSDPEPDQLAPH
jgi:CheY-like chemotaxis protein